ncbi:unnamed protein product [Clonostachys solani]|uniref:Uncharacterized protein n=1 Tax=Clonostachys solani TaxID=160281 RepID=A0A9P0EPW2_9HYPO|nr:unnamed protein product [Clonostachys solani]
MKQSSHSSDKDGWSHLTPPATSQNRPHEAIPDHSTNNAFDNPSGLHGNSFLFFGAGIAHDTSFGSQPQCSQDLSEELDSMPSAPGCPIMLSRNSMNPQFLECFQLQPPAAIGKYDCEEPTVSLLDGQVSNPFQTTSSAPIEVPPGSAEIPEIFLNSADNTESEYYYSSSYSSGQECSYPGTPHTPSVNSPLSDAGSFAQCDGRWLCVRCAQGFDGRHVPMCTKAHFKDLIKKMSTLSSMPPSLRGPIFELLEFPVSLDEVDISHENLGKIKDISADWNLEIYYGIYRLRVIDLTEMWRSLSTLQKARLSPIPFPAVFDKHYSRGSRPEKIFLRRGNLPVHLRMYVRWTNVLKFTTLHKISKDGERMERIAPQLYQIMTQVVLIELRRFERNIYEVLSKSLHHQGPRDNDPNAVPELVTALGSLLLSLRWQICVWKKYRPVLAQDINQEKRELRFALIQDICKRLYPYYFLCRDRCLPDPASLVPGMETHYANMTGSIRETFPTDFSEAGFKAWILDGDDTVRNCRVDEQSLIQSIL